MKTPPVPPTVSANHHPHEGVSENEALVGDENTQEPAAIYNATTDAASGEKAASKVSRKTTIIVARHAERLDYVFRDAGRNYLPTTSRPWDPPLSLQGREQGYSLGCRIVQLCEAHGLGNVSAVYSSPFLRCVETAVEVICGVQFQRKKERTKNKQESEVMDWEYENAEKEKPIKKEKKRREDKQHEMIFKPSALKVRIEHGLSETLNEKWYRSWCLPGSDGTWNYRPSWQNRNSIDDDDDADVASYHRPKKYNRGVNVYAAGVVANADPTTPRAAAHNGGSAHVERISSNIRKKNRNGESTSPGHVDVETIHPKAKVPVQQLLSTPHEIASRLRQEYSADISNTTSYIRPATTHRKKNGSNNDEYRSRTIDTEHVTSYHPIIIPHKWGNFESRKMQMNRVQNTVQALVENHVEETIVLISHGGPVTHLYERLTKKHWRTHGPCTYACVSVYSYEEESGAGTWKEVVVNDTSHIEE